MLQQKQLSCLSIFFTLFGIDLHSSQCPRLPKIAQSMQQPHFRSYQDLIVYQQQAHAYCDQIKSIQKQNLKGVNNIKNLSKKIQEKDLELYLKAACLIQELTIFISQTSVACSYYKNNTKKLSLTELQRTIQQHQKYFFKLQEIESLMLYAIPNSPIKK